MPIVVPGTKPPGRLPLQLRPEQFPEAEREAALHIERLLSSLAKYEINFVSALALFDSAETEMRKMFGYMAAKQEAGERADISPALQTVTEWSGMAARDGAITIYHFGNTVEAIRQSLPHCPTLSAKVDHSILRGASKYFRSEFPRYEAIRHVVTHAADFQATPSRRSQHSHKGGPIPFGRQGGSIRHEGNFDLYFSHNMMNRTYFVSYQGRAHSYEIDQETADKLFLTRVRVYSCFLFGFTGEFRIAMPVR